MQALHRHIGGLESRELERHNEHLLHRHIGGLEKYLT